MAKIKLKAPEKLTDLNGLNITVVNGEIEVEESEAINYYQYGFHQVEDQPISSWQQAE